MRSDSISLRQSMVIIFVAMFSPIIRVLPRVCAETAKKAAWLTPLVAVVPLCAYMVLCYLAFAYKNEGKGLAEIMLDVFGSVAGRVIAVLYLAYQVFYAGYIIRNSAERIISTAYPDGTVWIFAAVLTVVCAIAALGKLRSIARTAEIFFLLLAGTLIIVIIFSSQSVKPENLLPVSRLDAVPMLRSSINAVNLLSIGVYSLFLGGGIRIKEGKAWTIVRWMLLECVAVFLVLVITVGCYGAMFTWKTQQPFFVVVRDIVIFDILERIEAVVMAIWVVTDFVLVTVEFMVVAEILKTIFAAKERKLFALPAAAAAFIAALVIAPNAFALWDMTLKLMPKLNLVFAIILLPVILAIWVIKQSKRQRKEKLKKGSKSS